MYLSSSVVNACESFKRVSYLSSLRIATVMMCTVDTETLFCVCLYLRVFYDIMHILKICWNFQAEYLG